MEKQYSRRHLLQLQPIGGNRAAERPEPEHTDSFSAWLQRRIEAFRSNLYHTRRIYLGAGAFAILGGILLTCIDVTVVVNDEGTPYTVPNQDFADRIETLDAQGAEGTPTPAGTGTPAPTD